MNRPSDDDLRGWRFRVRAELPKQLADFDTEFRRVCAELSIPPGLREALSTTLRSEYSAPPQSSVENSHHSPSSQPTASQSTPVVLRSIDEFDLLEELPAGGMGVVYRSWDRLLNRQVALKQIRPGNELLYRPYFEREIVLTAGDRQPGIPIVYRSGRCSEGHPYFVMEWIAGQTLTAVMNDPSRGEDFGPEHLMAIFTQIVRTISIRHHATPPIAHGDLTPNNIKITGPFHEQVFVLDWGLARRALSQSDPATRASTSVGTPNWMAPEQERDGIINCQTDVYQCGLLLQGILKVCRLERPDYYADLIDLAHRCSETNPASRPQDALAILDELATIHQAEVARQVAVESAKRKAESALRRTRFMVAGSVLLATLVVIGLLAYGHNREQQRALVQATELQRYHQGIAHRELAIRTLTYAPKAEWHIGEDHLQAALVCFDQLLQNRPTSTLYRYEKADCLYLLGWHRFATLLKGGGKSGVVVRSDQFVVDAEAIFASLLPDSNGLLATSVPATEPSLSAAKRGLVRTQLEECWFLRACVYFSHGEYSETFALLDRMLESRLRSEADLLQRFQLRPPERELLGVAERILTNSYRRLNTDVATDQLILLRVVAQMAAEVEQSQLPWSRGSQADHARAIRLARALADSREVNPQAIYNTACVFALASEAKGITTAEQAARQQAALRYLNRLQSCGYFLTPRYARELATDQDLKGVRSLSEFQQLLDRVKRQPALAGIASVAGSLNWEHRVAP